MKKSCTNIQTGYLIKKEYRGEQGGTAPKVRDITVPGTKIITLVPVNDRSVDTLQSSSSPLPASTAFGTWIETTCVMVLCSEFWKGRLVSKNLR